MEARNPPVGDAQTVVSVFAQLPGFVLCLEGPDLVVVAANPASVEALGRPDPLGRPLREVAPELLHQRVMAQLEKVWASGEPVSVQGMRVQYHHADDDTLEFLVDVVAVPWRRADGSVRGVIALGQDSEERHRAQRVAEAGRVEAERRYAQARDVVTTLQEAMLPDHLPIVPGLQIAGRYLLAEEDTAAGGDWFDALTLPDGTVALVVGDVVGHGVQASAVMGRLRTVLSERLGSGGGLEAAMAALDAYAARSPGAEAATVNVVVLDPASGHMSHVAAGHPPPLVVSADGSCRRLAVTGDGPLGTGSAYRAVREQLAEGEMIVLYSDGIVERPGLTPEQGAAELAETVADTALNRALPHGAPAMQVERVCGQTLELLTRVTGHTDDVTLLAAQRTAPGPDLELTLPATTESVSDVQYELGQWLLGLGARNMDESALQHAVVELVTNAAEHAYREAGSGPAEVTVRAALRADGRVRVEVADRGRWREPALAEPCRGNGLIMAGFFADEFALRKGLDGDGTSAVVHRRLRRPVRVDQATTGRARRTGTGRLVVEEASDTPRLLTGSGVVDATTAERLDIALRQVTRGGALPVTLDLSGVTHLASAGVQVLHRLHALTSAHGGALTLYAPEGSVARSVLELAALPHTTRRPAGGS